MATFCDHANVDVVAVIGHESERNEYGIVVDPDPPSIEFTVTIKGVVHEGAFEDTTPTIVAVSWG